MRSLSNYSNKNNNNNHTSTRSPLKENNQLDGMDTPNNSNRQFFLRNASLGSRENTNPSANFSNKQDNLSVNPANSSLNGKSPFQQNQNMKGSFVQQTVNTQPGSQKKQQLNLPPTNPSRKKIFDDDTQSVSSMNTLKQHQYPPSIPPQHQQQMQQQQLQQQEIQTLPQQAPIAPSLQARQLQYPNEGRQDDKQNESELVKWQRMYSEQQFQLSQLQKAKQTADETHELEIEDTKKHFQFKLDESIKKQQELVIKMQQLQQASVAANNSLKLKESELQAKSEQLLQATQELQSRNIPQNNNNMNNGINYQLQEQKNELERIIADGKIYIEKIKNENNQKTELVHQLDREKKALEAKNALLAQQLEQAQKSCSTMRQEIDKLIASNQDVARRLEIERRERAEGQFQNKGQQFRQGDDRRAVSELEMKMVQLLDKNQQLSAERTSQQVIISDLERQLTDIQQQLTAQANQLMQNNANTVQSTHPSSGFSHIRQNNQPLPQITEELDEEMNNYLMLSRKAGNDMYALDLGELRQLARSAQEEAERLRAQLNSVKSQQMQPPFVQKQQVTQFLPPQQQSQQLQQQTQQQQVQQNVQQLQPQQQFPVTTVVQSRFPPSLLKPKTQISATPIQSVYVNHNTLPDQSPMKTSGMINTATTNVQIKPNSSSSLSSLSLPSQQILSSQQSTDEQLNKQPQQRTLGDIRNLGHFTSQPITTTTIVSNQPNTNTTNHPSLTPISYMIQKPSEVVFQQQQQQQQQQFQQPSSVTQQLNQRPSSSLSSQQQQVLSSPAVVSFGQLQYANTQQQQQQQQHQYSYEHNSGLKPARIMEGDHHSTTVASAYGHRLSLPPQSR